MKISSPIPEYEIIAPNEALYAWKHNEVTQQILKIVNQEKMNSSLRVGTGETLGENVIQQTARAVGYIEGLGFLIDLVQLQFVVEGMEDEDDRKSGSQQVKESA